MAKNTTLNELADMLVHVIHHMATRSDLGELREELPGIIALELKPLHHELKEINRRLDALEEQYKDLNGLTREIDDVRERVCAIEKHLGINKKIAA